MTKSDAIRLLKETAWFADASNDFLDVIADKMELHAVDDGYVFVEEDEIMTHIFVIEEGTLSRTKKSNNSKLTRRQSLRNLSKLDRRNSLQEESVLIDTVQGRGRVTGLLHNIHEDTKAYATVTSSGPAKVWALEGKAFQSIIGTNSKFALQMMQAMSHELRGGSRSLRALMKKVKGKHRQGKEGEVEDSGKTCRVLCYDATSWVTEGFQPAIESFNKEQDDGYAIEMEFTTERLSESSATYAAGYDAICLFVNDTAGSEVLQTLSLMGVQMIAMRCAGFDRVDTKAARAYGMTVARVPAYSPYAVAEMAIALLMTVNRKIAKASNRVKMANFTLDAGLMGMDIYGKTVGVMGTGKIGQILCRILNGFGAKLICYDVYESDEVKELGGTYVSKEDIFAQSDILFLMMPLLSATHHTINESVLPKLKKGVLLINTSRGGLIDTAALLKGLRSGIIRGVGMDVYENEQDYFFQDWSARHIEDPDLVALLGNNNVVLTAHQAFFTQEAVDKIVSTTIDNIRDFHLKRLTGQSHPNNCIPAVES
jgi:D-lactate dehydrogenase